MICPVCSDAKSSGLRDLIFSSVGLGITKFLPSVLDIGRGSLMFLQAKERSIDFDAVVSVRFFVDRCNLTMYDREAGT